MSPESRAAALRGMLEKRPGDARLKFGLALEVLKEGETEEGIALLRSYLADAEDEGNGWGRLGSILRDLGRSDEARSAYEKGINAARRHGHPTMADEFQEILDDWEEGE